MGIRVEFDAARSDGEIETYGMSRVSVLLPEDIVAAIDDLVGPRGRGSFLAEAARELIERRGHAKPTQARPAEQVESEDASDVFVPGSHDQSEEGTWGRGY